MIERGGGQRDGLDCCADTTHVIYFHLSACLYHFIGQPSSQRTPSTLSHLLNLENSIHRFAMAAIDVLPSSPTSPGPMASWLGFEDYLDFPSPLSTPRLAPAQSSMNIFSQTTNGVGAGIASAAAVSNTLAAKPSATAETDITSGPAPAPGSSPETLFRYYLAVELRKMGNPADDATLDRYVAQHCDSFTRAMERNQANAAAAANADSLQAFKPQQVRNDNLSASTSAFALPQSNGSIDPHMVELHQPSSRAAPSFEVPVITTQAATPVHSAHTPSSASSPSASFTYRSKSVEDDDAMSEDDEERDIDSTMDASFSAKKGEKRSGTLRTIEETPIEGSIMGPSNELRPDPETYRNLTSKEKRQLRNKISARNFRTRRKEHISHLELQVADRDTTIEGLRQQLANISMQNKELQEEIRTLKAKAISSTDVSRIIDALQKSAVSGGSETNEASGRPLTPSVSQSPRSSSPRPANAIAKPNTRKDLSGTPSSASGSKSFWGGVNGNTVPTVLV